MKEKSKSGNWVGKHAGSFFLSLIAGISSLLPLRCLHFIGSQAGSLLYFVWKDRRKIALANLRLAFGEDKDEKELRSIARRSFQNLTGGLCEVIKFMFLPAKSLDERMVVEGKENLLRVIEKGKGVIAFTAHLGCFPLIGRKLAAEGLGFHYIIRFPDDAGATSYIKKMGKKVNVGFISVKPKLRCVGQCVKVLRNKEILCLLGDQYVMEGIDVNFFGHSVSTAAGPVILALRTGAEIVPMFIVRGDDNKHYLRIEPPFRLNITGNTDEDIRENIARLTEKVEASIRSYPDQWTWLHRRWRGVKKG